MSGKSVFSHLFATGNHLVTAPYNRCPVSHTHIESLHRKAYPVYISAIGISIGKLLVLCDNDNAAINHQLVVLQKTL